MIAIYRLTAGGAVERAATATSVAEARKRLATLRCPAVAYDGHEAVGATGHTRAVDLAAITAHVSPRCSPETLSCAWTGCAEPAARVHINTRRGVAEFCAGHRHVIADCARGLSVDTTREVLALMRLVGAMHCTACADCRARVRAAAGIVATNAGRRA